jgi:hypothetical protein
MYHRPTLNLCKDRKKSVITIQIHALLAFSVPMNSHTKGSELSTVDWATAAWAPLRCRFWEPDDVAEGCAELGICDERAETVTGTLEPGGQLSNFTSRLARGSGGSVLTRCVEKSTGGKSSGSCRLAKQRAKFSREEEGSRDSWVEWKAACLLYLSKS